MPCPQRELLIDEIRTITDEIVALEINSSAPDQLHEVRERRERLLLEYGHHVASHGCAEGTQHAAA